ncbi:MAG TPA: hypothetical protein VJW23_10200 [Propionibacteriaceae bacterium]|nr:hypothetical protein [Propionibacteriaceae bacterium]
MRTLGVRVVRELVCDLCGSTDGVLRWHLQREGKKRSPDLCDKHGKPLVELLESLPAKRGNQGQREVLTEAQVKQKVRAFRAAAKKRA